MCDCNTSTYPEDSPATNPPETTCNKSELQLIMEAAGWEEYSSELGKTVYRPKDRDPDDRNYNSIFIATKGLHDPHAYSEDHARFCVEAIGPDITNGTEEYDHFDRYKRALSKIAEFMKRYVSDDEFGANIDELIHAN
jgi:hypothetical protein